MSSRSIPEVSRLAKQRISGTSVLEKMTSQLYLDPRARRQHRRYQNHALQEDQPRVLNPCNA